MSDKATCWKCDDPVDGMGTVFVIYGDFDRERQGFKRGDHHWHVCEECWRTEYDAKKATEYRPDNADELWAILNTSDGKLVADFSTYFIPGPCYIRVVDDEIEGATVKAVDVSDDPTTDYDLGFEPEPTDPHDLFIEEMLDHEPRPIFLVPVDETPFAELEAADE